MEFVLKILVPLSIIAISACNSIQNDTYDACEKKGDARTCAAALAFQIAALEYSLAKNTKDNVSDPLGINTTLDAKIAHATLVLKNRNMPEMQLETKSLKSTFQSLNNFPLYIF